MCFVSLESCEEAGDPISPLVFQVMHRRPPSGIWTHVFLVNRSRCLVVEEHRVSNENAEVQDERFQDVHPLHLPATANDEIERVLLMESMATRGTWVPPASMSKSRKGEFCSKPYQFRWSVVFASTRIDICQAIWRYGSSKTNCRMKNIRNTRFTQIKSSDIEQLIGHVWVVQAGTLFFQRFCDREC